MVTLYRKYSNTFDIQFKFLFNIKIYFRNNSLKMRNITIIDILSFTEIYFEILN